MKLIIDIPEELKNKCDELEFEKAINYVRWFDGTLTNAIENGTPISDNATNGEYMIAMFPNARVYKHKNFVEFWYSEEENGMHVKFRTTWWNAPYQKGGK